MRLAPCAPPPGLRYDALVDAPVTSIASSMLDDVRAATGEPNRESLWCAYWDQSEELGPYYLHERMTDAWYRVLVEGPYEAAARTSNDEVGRTLRVERQRPVSRVRFIGRWGRRASALLPNGGVSAAGGSRMRVLRFPRS
jgi:hypothetical protein